MSQTFNNDQAIDHRTTLERDNGGRHRWLCTCGDKGKWSQSMQSVDGTRRNHVENAPLIDAVKAGATPAELVELADGDFDRCVSVAITMINRKLLKDVFELQARSSNISVAN